MNMKRKFQVGDRIYSKRDDQRGEIIRFASPISGEPYYQVELVGGKRVTLGEKDLKQTRTPLKRLADGDFGYASDFDLLTQATSLFFGYRYGELSCLSNSRLEPKPYQIFVAHRVLQDLHPRYMLADEVGLGKTIEAGLILKELKARGVVDRVLVVVPASLREQWKGEMDIKFNEQFYIYNGDTIRENRRRHPDRNPWTLDKNIIVSLPFARLQISRELKEKEGEQSFGINEAGWDLVIFDEAHHLRRYLQGETIDSKRSVTKSYRLGEALAERTKSLLLLTAVPLQLSQYETYSLIELLDSSLFASYEEFKKIEAIRNIIGLLENYSRNKLQSDEQAFIYFYRKWYHCGSSRDKFWEEVIECCIKKGPIYHRKVLEKEIANLKVSFCETLKDPEAILFIFVKIGLLTEDVLYDSDSTIYSNAKEKFIEFVEMHTRAMRLWFKRRHKLSQIMLRNRKREVLKDEMVERRAHRVPVDLTSNERDLYHVVSQYIRKSYARVSGQNQGLGLVLTVFRKLLVSSPHALAKSLESRARRIEQTLARSDGDPSRLSDADLEEREETLESFTQLDDLFSLTGGLSPDDARNEIDTLRNLAKRARMVADPYDSKAKKLVDAVDAILDDDPTEKILIFTQFRETQSYLKRLLNGNGYGVALFHGEDGSGGYSKRDEFKRFKKDPHVQVMISTRVGGEGLNLQFCHIMFNYDMPWNPMRIEQRIGRLDRLGQERDVHIFNFFLKSPLKKGWIHPPQNGQN
jgi:SNF2 family DNA or RNA helicase